MKCPYCNSIVTNLKIHLRSCKIKDHYKIINNGNLDCKHDFCNVVYSSVLNNDKKERVVLTIRCMDCELHLTFDTFETIWLPNIKEIIKK